MRFRVRARNAVFLVFAVLVPSSIVADNIADCDDPPGGRIACEDTQAAFCKVVRGKVDRYCKTPPRNLSGPDLSAWAFSEATGNA